MVTTEQPITRTELREELTRFRDEIREHYATKADLYQLENRLSAKIDSMLWKIAGVVAGMGGIAATAVIGVLRLWQ